MFKFYSTLANAHRRSSPMLRKNEATSEAGHGKENGESNMQPANPMNQNWVQQDRVVVNDNRAPHRLTNPFAKSQYVSSGMHIALVPCCATK